MATSYRDSVGEPEGTVAIDGTREKKKKKMSERRDKGKGEDAGQKKATVSVDELLPKVELLVSSHVNNYKLLERHHQDLIFFLI